MAEDKKTVMGTSGDETLFIEEVDNPGITLIKRREYAAPVAVPTQHLDEYVAEKLRACAISRLQKMPPQVLLATRVIQLEDLGQ